MKCFCCPEEEVTLPWWRNWIKIVELVLCVAFFLAAFYLCDYLPVHERPIPYQLLNKNVYVLNLVNNEENVGNTVSDAWLYFSSAVIPLAVQMLMSQFLLNRKRFPHDVHSSLCAYFLAFALVVMTSEMVKCYVGYLRPNFYATCQPDADYEECTGRNHDPRKSFPSGHASYAFCGLLLFTQFLHTRFGLASICQIVPVENSTAATTSGPESAIEHQSAIDGEAAAAAEAQSFVNSSVGWKMGYSREPALYRLISVLALLPTGLALWIAVSRVHDNKHFPADVVGGSLLGAGISIFTHGLYFNNLQ